MPIFNPTPSTSGIEGGVTGPGTSTTNHVALFADSSGVTLKDGGALGDAATLNLGTSVGTIAEGSHAHEIADVNGLQTALASIPSPAPSSYEISNINGLTVALAGKADTFHNHEIAEVTGLQAALDLKLEIDKLELIIAISDETTALTTGTAKATFRMPYAMTLTDVRASVTTAPTGSALVIDIKESGTTIFSTKLSIDATEKTSTTAATPKVLSDTSLADDAEITINIDQIGSTIAGAGAKVTLIGTRE